MAGDPSGRRVLVTGADGFIGLHLVRHLLGGGDQVVAVVRRLPPRRLDPGLASLTLLPVELTDAPAVASLLADAEPDLVFHLAAAGVRGGVRGDAVMADNLAAARALVSGLLQLGRPLRLVNVGSCFEYGEGAHMAEDHDLNPTNAYGEAKRAAGALIHDLSRGSAVSAVTVRPFTPYGPFEAPSRLVPHVICHALDGRDIPLTSGRQQRDFLYVADLAEGIAAAAGAPADAMINLCSGTGTPVREMVELILELMGNPVAAQFGAVPDRAGEMWVQSGDNARAAEWLGWRPKTDLAEGLRQTIDWVADHRDLLARLDDQRTGG